jgi:8-oxo-dGTP pyrophosphatase MutT (NUDIX family)
MHIRQSAGGIIVNSRGEVVIVSQGTGTGATWSLPKGGVEPGEDFLTAAKREIDEETGITELEFIKEFPEYSRNPMRPDGSPRTDLLKVIHFFLFKSEQEDLSPKDPHNPIARWVTKEEALELISNARDKEFFASIIDMI